MAISASRSDSVWAFTSSSGSFPVKSQPIDLPNACASAPMRSLLGEERPDSYCVMAFSDTPIMPASLSCVNPKCSLCVLMRMPRAIALGVGGFFLVGFFVMSKVMPEQRKQATLFVLRQNISSGKVLV